MIGFQLLWELCCLRLLILPWRRKWQPTPVFLPWKIPWTEEHGGLQSVGLQRVGHDWATKPPPPWYWVFSLVLMQIGANFFFFLPFCCVEYITTGYVLMCLSAPFGFHILDARCNSSVGFPGSRYRSVHEEELSLRTRRHEAKGRLCFLLWIHATGLKAKWHVSGIWQKAGGQQMSVALIKDTLCVCVCLHSCFACIPMCVLTNMWWMDAGSQERELNVCLIHWLQLWLGPP